MRKDVHMMKQLALLAVCAILCSLLAACSLTSSTASGPCTANNLTMGPNTFCTDAISLPRGGTITFVDESSNGSIHILTIGTFGDNHPEPGAPDFGGAAGHSMNPGDTWTTPPWNTVGTYHVTCTVHPTTMNLTVTVTSS